METTSTETTSMVKKIIVIAGTPIDTRMGAHILATSREQHTRADAPLSPPIFQLSLPVYEPLEFPISRNPQEQNELQYLQPDRLHELYEAKVREGIAAGGSAVFLYCNSLSASIDYRSTATKLGIPTVSPLDIYADWAGRYSRLGVIAANSRAAAGIEAHMRAVNPQLEVISCGLLPVVQAIEEQLPAREIIQRFGLAELLGWFASLSCGHILPPNILPQTEKTPTATRDASSAGNAGNASDQESTARNGSASSAAPIPLPRDTRLEAVILGCTHFPYLKAELASLTNLPLLDPATDMLARL